MIELLIVIAIIGVLAGIAIPTYQSSVRKANEAAAVASDGGVYQLPSMSIQCTKSTGLIRAHKPAIANNVRNQDGRQSTLPQLAVTFPDAHAFLTPPAVGFIFVHR